MKPANNAPLYACVYAGLAEIARDHGYAWCERKCEYSRMVMRDGKRVPRSGPF